MSCHKNILVLSFVRVVEARRRASMTVMFQKAGRAKHNSIVWLLSGRCLAVNEPRACSDSLVTQMAFNLPRVLSAVLCRLLTTQRVNKCKINVYQSLYSFRYFKEITR